MDKFLTFFLHTRKITLQTSVNQSHIELPIVVFSVTLYIKGEIIWFVF